MVLPGLVVGTSLTDYMDLLNDWILHAATAWWVLPSVFILSLVDGFFPIVPSESLLVGLSSIWISQGLWQVALLAAVGAAGAFCGDQVAYFMGRALGKQGFKWMRRRAVAKMLVTAEHQLEKRGGVLIFTARYVPVGRVAVNFTAGATGFSRKEFMFYDAIACVLWGAYSVTIGTVGGQWMEDNRILGILISIIIAMTLGWILDRVVHRLLWRYRPDSEVLAAKERPPRREITLLEEPGSPDTKPADSPAKDDDADAS